MKTYNVYTTPDGTGPSFVMTAPLDAICMAFNLVLGAVQPVIDAHFDLYPYGVRTWDFNGRGPMLRGRRVDTIFIFPPDITE